MYYFIKEKNKNNKFDISNIIFVADDEVTLSELVTEFENFLKACGFVVKGTLDFQEDESE